MKPFTKSILDKCTNALEVEGFRRKRRGLLVRKKLNEIVESIGLQEQDYPTGLVDIHVYFHITWVPVEEIVAMALGENFRLGKWYTITHRLFFEKYISFEPEFSPEPEISRLTDTVATEIQSAFPDLSDKRLVREKVAHSAGNGPDFPERLIAIDYVLGGKQKARETYEQLFSQVKHPQLQERLQRFWGVVVKQIP